jgi:hypothetical protein
MEVEAVDEGILGKILIPAGTENVKVNTEIAILVADGESAGDVPAKTNGAAGAPKPAEAKAETPAAAPPSAAAVADDPDRCQLDLAAHQLFDADGAEIPITTMEFELLRMFVEHPGKALSRDRILTLTRNREWDPYDRSIDIRIARLRRKIEADPENPQAIRCAATTAACWA